MPLSHTRPVVVVGGNRIPFAKAGGPYARATTQDLLTTTLDGLVARFGLAGAELGEVVGGAVMKHPRDYNLTREAVLGSRLAPSTPAYDLQRACTTSLEAAVAVGSKIALGQIDAGIAAGADSVSDAPISVNEDLRHILLGLSRARTPRQRLALIARLRPWHLAPLGPQATEPRTGLSMGDHAAITAKEWGLTRQEQDALAVRSHHRLAAAYDRGFFDDLVTAYLGQTRDQILRPDTSLESLAALKPVFGRSGPEPTMTAGNSTALTDGAAAVLLSSPGWAAQRGLPVLAQLVDAQSAAVDYVSGSEGLLMAPTYAVSKLLKRNKLSLQDFDVVEIHEAFASTVLAMQAAWESPEFCRDRLGLDAPLGPIDPDRLNQAGSSLATGHPFAATGARILATTAKLLAERGSGRALVAVCAAGGLGAAVILETVQ